MTNSMIEVFAAFAVFILLVFVFRSFKRKKPLKKQEEVVPSLSAPTVVVEKKLNLRNALASWVPLLKSKSKDISQWEALLIGADMGPKLTTSLLQEFQKSSDEPLHYFKSSLDGLLKGAEAEGQPWTQTKPWVLFLVGVNGVGKTTNLVKIGKFFQKINLSVGVIGADTFRKAAIEQLQRGCERASLEFFSMFGAGEDSEGADPSAVVFDGLKKFSSKDVILVDTSGRLHTKKNLMEELKKMKRVSEKALPGSPHGVWLIVDSTLGQNAVAQGRAFNEALGLTGMVLSKVDGLSRGGTVFQLFQELRVPIYFLGVGEGIEDLIPFEHRKFIEDLFDQDPASF